VYFEQEDVNPMEGAINIVDAMLVFSCGLMLSLVIYWNIDIKQEPIPVTQGAEMTEVEDIKEELDASADESGEGIYERVGTVYVDPATGKMYLVDEGGATAEGSAASNETGSDAATGTSG